MMDDVAVAQLEGDVAQMRLALAVQRILEVDRALAALHCVGEPKRRTNSGTVSNQTSSAASPARARRSQPNAKKAAKATVRRGKR